MREIWFGIFQLGTFSSGSLAYILLDLLFSALAAFFIFQALNSQRGWRYVGFLSGSFALLVVSSIFALPGLHLFAQGAVIVLTVALPVLFQDEWQSMLSSKPNANQSPAKAAPLIGTPAVAGLSVLFALLLVGASTGVTTRTGTFPDGVKLTAVNVPDGLSASFGNTQTVQVVVSAPRDKWQSLTADSFSAAVDLGGQKEGTYNLPVQVTSKVSGILIVKTTPAEVVVTVEPVVKKTVAVAVSFSGKAGNDLVPGQPEITPDKVELTGPKSVVSTITQVIAPIKLAGQTANIDQKVDLSAQTPDGQTITIVSVNPAQAEVKVPLVKAGKLKTVGVQATITGQPKSGYWVQTVSVTPPVVTVTGPADQLEALGQISTAAFSVDGLTANKTQSLTLTLPSGITVADQTQTVSVTVTIAQTATTKTITPQLTYAGLADNLQVTGTNPPSLSAIVSGLSSLLGSTSDGDIKVALDLSAYKSAGTYAVTIINSSFTFPSGIALVSFLPSSISVTLSAK